VLGGGLGGAGCVLAPQKETAGIPQPGRQVPPRIGHHQALGQALWSPIETTVGLAPFGLDDFGLQIADFELGPVGMDGIVGPVMAKDVALPFDQVI
jgi:hypothetical protein